MKEYSLEKLNSDSFEQLVKSLAIKIISLAGQVFPSGPDAGRDFSYDGEIKGYEGKEWNGLTVVQAKFKENIQGGKSDVDWLERQLDSELTKYKSNDNHPFRPKYYIIATNVNLSGADSYKEGTSKTGGLTKIGIALDKWKEEIGLIDYDIWSAEKIHSLLDIHGDIRNSYSAWITTSDVLNKILNHMDAQEKKLLFALKIFLSHCLKRDKNVRLKDAGSVLDDNIRSSQVFIDLPAYCASPEKPFLLTKRLTELSKGIYKPTLNTNTNSDLGNKILILGGPGQGKSTASVFLTQLFRAHLLNNDSGFTPDELTKKIIQETLEKANAEQISNNLPNRYPLYTSLPHYADRISEARQNRDTPPSLLKYITQEIVSISDTDITVTDMRKWLSEQPCIIVLDGLDEVPPTGEREKVIEEIERLISEVSSLGSDVVFVATSRPQGYNSDLDPESWQIWKLADLDSSAAIRYAKLLTAAYYKDDKERQQRITYQLESSLGNPMTSKLMSTPLQVTILNLIVDIGGGIPNSRWNLFNEYFETLKRRERSKAGLSQEALVRNQQFIGPIHQRAGLVLHIAAEKAGQATSHLDQSRFNDLIKNYLRSEDFDQCEIERRSNELSTLSLNRLVLLSSREEGRVSFDVRSLQEYMAASALTSADPLVICDRLEYLAGKAHWQHVITIAASRCFSEDAFHHSRAAITNIPRRLDQIPHYKITGRGPRLSLELFIDGIAVDQPKYRRDLALHALELLNSGVEALDYQLHKISEAYTEELIHNEIRTKYLCSHNPEVRAATWGLLDRLAENNDRKAKFFLATSWPKETKDVFNIIKYGVFPKNVKLNKSILFDVIFSNAFTRTIKTQLMTPRSRLSSSEHETEKSQDREALDLVKFIRSQFKTVPAFDPSLALTTSYKPIYSLSTVEIPSVNIDMHQEWFFLISCVAFSKKPSKETLATCVSEYLKINFSEEDDKKLITNYIPWVISATLDKLCNSTDIIADIHAGLFGEPATWLAAEERVKRGGLKEIDFHHYETNGGIGQKIDKVGTLGKMNLNTFSLINNSNKFDRSKLCDIWKNSEYLPVKRLLLEVLGASLSFSTEALSDPREVLIFLDMAMEFKNISFSFTTVNILIPVLLKQNKIPQICTILQNCYLLRHSSNHAKPSDETISKLCALATLHDEFSGLLIGICFIQLSFRVELPISTSTLEKEKNSTNYRVSISCAALLLVMDSSRTSEFVEILLSHSKHKEKLNYIYIFIESFIYNSIISHDTKTEILSRLAIEVETSELDEIKYNLFKTLLQRHLDSEQSQLSDSKIWEALKFPQDALNSVN